MKHNLNKKYSFKQLFAEGGEVSAKALKITKEAFDDFEFSTGYDVLRKYAKFLEEATSEKDLYDKMAEYHKGLDEFVDDNDSKKYAKRVWEEYHHGKEKKEVFHKEPKFNIYYLYYKQFDPEQSIQGDEDISFDELVWFMNKIKEEKTEVDLSTIKIETITK